MTDPKRKLCPKCNEIKRLSEFQKDKNSKDGHYYICGSCANIARKAQRLGKRAKPVKTVTPDQAVTNKVNERATLILIKTHRNEWERLRREQRKILDPS